MKAANSQSSPRRSSRSRRRNGLALEVLPSSYAICRLEPGSEIPSWALSGGFSSISQSPDELSVVCEEAHVPDEIKHERAWKTIKVQGPLDMTLVGVMASIALPLARAKISLFTVSTFDTDYVLVREKNLDRACEVLREAGHRIESKPAHRPRRAKKGREPEKRPAERARERRPRDDREREERPAERARERRPRDECEREERPRREREERPQRARAEEPEREERPRREREERPWRAQKERPQRERKERPRRERGERPRSARVAREERPRDEPLPVDVAVVEEEEAVPVEETVPKAPAKAVPEAFEAPHGKVSPPFESPRGDKDRDVTSQGLFTGAIPQHAVETTEELFTSLGLSAPILATIAEMGFEHPTPVQSAVIPRALEGQDVVGLAETGSGKTAAFALPLAERLTHGRGVRGLILCPTREIALQTQAFLGIFGRDHQLETVPVIGGVRMGPQIQGLRRGPDIIVATPGRLADHLRRRNVKLDRIEHLVLDEADHMLDLGFLPQIREILEQMPTKRQTMMFSATMPPPIERLTQQFMHEPVRVDIRPVGQTAEGIEHRLYLVKEEAERKDCLVELLKEVEGSTLVFVRRKLHTEWLARQLEHAGFPVERIHSDRSQGQRVNALRGFREGAHEVLVATDVAARGIDIPALSHVVNFGPPDSVEDYVHRAGRTARGSAKGIVSTIGTWQDKETVRQIEATIGKKLPRCRVSGVEPYHELKQRKQVRRRRLL